MLNHAFSLTSAGTVVLTVIFSMQTWARLLPKTLTESADSPMTFLNRTAVGTIIFSFVLFGLASFHALTPGALKILMGISIFSAAGESILLFFRFKSCPFKINMHLLFLGAYLLVVSILALLPADEKDEIIYHLEIPRQMLAQHGWAWLPNNIYAFFPSLTELFYAFGLGVSGEVAARLFHTAFGLLLILTLYRYARRYLERAWASVTAAIFMTVPSVMLMMSWAYVDLAFTWFALLAWIAVEDMLQVQDKRRMILAGLFCGAAACVKYTGIQYTLLLSTMILFNGFIKKNIRTAATQLFVLLTTTGLIFLPYLIRNIIYTGWPLYPFHLPGFLLKAGLNWDAERAALYVAWIKTYGSPIGANSALLSLTAPLRVFFDGEFNNPAKFEGVIGSLFLLLPILYAARKMKKAPLAPAVFFLLFMYYWAMTTQQARFLIPILPIASLLLAIGLSKLNRVVVVSLLGAGLIFNLGVVFNEVNHKKPWNYLLGKEKREEYLLRQHYVYAMYAAANHILPHDAKVYLLQMKNYGYYLDRNWTADFLFERYALEKYLQTHSRPDQVADFFRQENVTHLLVDQNTLRSPATGMEANLLIPFDQFLALRARLIAMKENIMLYELTPPPNAI